MSKPQINYTIGTSTIAGETTTYPVIVNREKAVDLADVVKKAIDTGRLPGIKDNAAESIAAGVCEQIYQEFCEGHGVKLGDYLFAQLYLDGTCNANGDLTEENKINARLTKGKEFDLKLSDFSWHLEGSETAPAITNLYSQGSSATQEDAKRSILVLNSTGVINGERLVAEGAMTSVIVMDPSGESVAEVDTFSKSSEALLMFEIPRRLRRRARRLPPRRRARRGRPRRHLAHLPQPRTPGQVREVTFTAPAMKTRQGGLSPARPDIARCARVFATPADVNRRSFIWRHLPLALQAV